MTGAIGGRGAQSAEVGRGGEELQRARRRGVELKVRGKRGGKAEGASAGIEAERAPRAGRPGTHRAEREGGRGLSPRMIRLGGSRAEGAQDVPSDGEA